ncbi:hypothetical protein, partial [Pseudomonas savastanoi]|uniref:hypothetical protein n=1 Tax=Pseudomonas savastanoi TaxID=29438 RepID=UPI001C8210E1
MANVFSACWKTSDFIAAVLRPMASPSPRNRPSLERGLNLQAGNYGCIDVTHTAGFFNQLQVRRAVSQLRLGLHAPPWSQSSRCPD